MDKIRNQDIRHSHNTDNIETLQKWVCKTKYSGTTWQSKNTDAE
jgi:hypothetical protein